MKCILTLINNAFENRVWMFFWNIPARIPGKWMKAKLFK